MYYFLTFLLLIAVNFSSYATEVDFTKAYIIPEETTTDRLRIGGIETQDGDVVLINSLLLGFDEETTTFHLLDAKVQTSDEEWLAQRLRNTMWAGEYRTTNNLYLTELHFKTVQQGFIAGEMIHKTAEVEPANYLHIEVAGNIVTQYLLDIEGDGELVWIDAKEANYEGVLPPSHIRQLINLKRMRALESRHVGRGWGRHNEYHLVWMNDSQILTGNAGVTAAETFSGGNGLTGNGIIELYENKPPVEQPPEIFE